MIVVPRTLGLLAAALALAGCWNEPAERTITAPSGAAPAATGVDAPRQAAQGASQASQATGLALDGEGLRLIAARGSTRLLTFGTSRGQVEDAVGSALGAQAKRSELDECGAGPMQFSDFDDLKLHFQADRFVGWYLDGGTKLATMDGIMIGSARAKVAESRVVTLVPDSTLGTEFVLGARDGDGIRGFFDGAGDSAQVTGLYAGTTCFFR